MKPPRKEIQEEILKLRKRGPVRTTKDPREHLPIDSGLFEQDYKDQQNKGQTKLF